MHTYEVDSRQKDRPTALYVRHWDGYDRPDYTRLFDLEPPYDNEFMWHTLAWTPNSTYNRRDVAFSYITYREIDVSLTKEQLKAFFLHLISSTSYMNYVEIEGWQKESKTWKLHCYIHPESYKEFW